MDGERSGKGRGAGELVRDITMRARPILQTFGSVVCTGSARVLYPLRDPVDRRNELAKSIVVRPLIFSPVAKETHLQEAERIDVGAAQVDRPAQHLVILEQMRAIFEGEESGDASFVLLSDPSVDWVICLSRQLGIESCDVEVGGGQIPLDIP